MEIIYQILKPLLMTLPAELAHNLSVSYLKIFSTKPKPLDPALALNIAGLMFPSPIGMAAGFDKNAEVPEALFGLGFGMVEVGTLTPKPQDGNPTPRIFRLPEDQGVINRLGFNNKGFAAGIKSVLKFPKGSRPGPLGINIGANKTSEDKIKDYREGIRVFKDQADYITINISSPNTPGLRDLQAQETLKPLIKAVQAELGKASVPLFVKIAPDIDEKGLKAIVTTALEAKVTGLIISNTTTGRPKTLKSKNKNEVGGLSGQPLFDSSTKLLRKAYQLSKGKLVLIGVGGVSNAEQALEKIMNGASLVQLYTGFIYGGPGLIKTINSELVSLLKAKGFASVSEAIGAAVKL